MPQRLKDYSAIVWKFANFGKRNTTKNNHQPLLEMIRSYSLFSKHQKKLSKKTIKENYLVLSRKQLNSTKTYFSFREAFVAFSQLVSEAVLCFFSNGAMICSEKKTFDETFSYRILCFSLSISSLSLKRVQTITVQPWQNHCAHVTCNVIGQCEFGCGIFFRAEFCKFW